jgi:subtilisin family serine protease
MKKTLIIVAVLALATATSATGNVHGRLEMMRIAREAGALADLESRGLFDDSSVWLSIRVSSAYHDATLDAIKSLGAEFAMLDGDYARVGNTYAVRVPWDELDALADVEGVEWIEPDWRPVVVPPLDVSVPEIEADLCWPVLDPLGYYVTGRGVKICDFDTGIDVFHPMFWHRSELLYAWLDVNVNNQFDPGTDAVDLNFNGTPDAGETLSYFEAPVDDPYGVGGVTNPAGFTLDMDWLYNDANGNGIRDYGAAGGFNESSPSFGELFFVAEDVNQNGVLEVGEGLFSLDTCKIERRYDTNSIERVYGVDLMQSEGDANGHGTGVCGITAGGHYDPFINRRLVGVAPGATLMLANFFSNVPHTAAQAWGETNGANVMIYEIGSWIGDYLDGSSAVEVNIDTLAAHGITQVNPNGNLAGAGKHFYAHVFYPNTDSVFLTMQLGYGNYLYLSLIWPGAGTDPSLAVREPGGTFVAFTTNGNYALGPYNAWYSKTTSTRGTVLADIWISHASQISGVFTLYIAQSTSGNTVVDGYIADNVSGWSGGTWFNDHATDDGTVDWPANADSAIGVASYSTRGPFGLPAGQISTFSGRGARVDGYQVSNIAAPGNYDVFTSRSKDESGAPFGGYRWFGGTSAAGPHVAGAAAILQQYDSTLGGGGVRNLLEAHAFTDGFTGSVPNHTWGWGKLRIHPALMSIVGVDDETTPVMPTELALHHAHPNPFNPTTVVSFDLPRASSVRIEAFDVLGRSVSVLAEGEFPAGSHDVSWDASGLPSGMYLLRLSTGDATATTKVVLLK